MNYKCKIKPCIVLMLLMSSALYGQAQSATPFNGNLTLVTSYDYWGSHVGETTVYFPNDSSDQHWRIYKKGECNNYVITPIVGRIKEEWIEDGPEGPLGFGKWVHSTGNGPGSYVFRFVFCVSSLVGETPGDLTADRKFYSIVAADNSIQSLSLDGTMLINYSESVHECPGSIISDQDYGCPKLDSAMVPVDLLTPGIHIFEFEVASIDDTVGLYALGVLQGVNGFIMPSGAGYTLECLPKGQIMGTVFDDVNRNGIRDVGENPLNNILVQVSDIYSLVQETTTGEDGTYSFYGLNVIGTPYDYYTYTVTANSNGASPGEVFPETRIVAFTFSDFATDFLKVCADFGIYSPPPPICDGCIPYFFPLGGKQYLLSAWVKEPFGDLFPDNYINSGIRIKFNNGTVQLPIMRASGPIIDRWQRIEASFYTPGGISDMDIELVNDGASDDVYFDDVRIHPFQSNMQSFVYNPATQKLDAILDENNFATRYEYDDEGILIRIKKETERGVETIKEMRSNQSKIK